MDFNWYKQAAENVITSGHLTKINNYSLDLERPEPGHKPFLFHLVPYL